ncbi:MAG: LpxD N-terminal domain-containing protein, partial [Pseudomonadota bacterium]|nr:LpxD N-terminal domain-containing protein [Pseudomonadota bacterium]
MEHPGFFDRAGPFSLGEVVAATETVAGDSADLKVEIRDIRTLDDAGPHDVAFLDNPKYLDQFRVTNAFACFVSTKFASEAPSGLTPLISPQPYRSFALALGLFYPDALFSATTGGSGWAKGSTIHPTAELETGAIVEPGAVIG